MTTFINNVPLTNLLHKQTRIENSKLDTLNVEFKEFPQERESGISFKGKRDTLAGVFVFFIEVESQLPRDGCCQF